jgi:hypothetical protein
MNTKSPEGDVLLQEGHARNTGNCTGPPRASAGKAVLSVTLCGAMS